MSNDNKESLNTLLVKHRAQPVGSGYIDIIVMRENHRAFVEDILLAGFKISCISWWEYVDELDSSSKLGMGGPRSDYYSGWFSEITVDVDEIVSSKNVQLDMEQILEIIENKKLQFPDMPMITFKDFHPLTPAFWLEELYS